MMLFPNTASASPLTGLQFSRVPTNQSIVLFLSSSTGSIANYADAIAQKRGTDTQSTNPDGSHDLEHLLTGGQKKLCLNEMGDMDIYNQIMCSNFEKFHHLFSLEPFVLFLSKYFKSVLTDMKLN